MQILIVMEYLHSYVTKKPHISNSPLHLSTYITDHGKIDKYKSGGCVPNLNEKKSQREKMLIVKYFS